MSRDRLWPFGHRDDFDVYYDFRESPWVVLSKVVNKDYSGYGRRNGARRNRERLYKIPGSSIDSRGGSRGGCR